MPSFPSLLCLASVPGLWGTKGESSEAWVPRAKAQQKAPANFAHDCQSPSPCLCRDCPAAICVLACSWTLC